MARIEMSNAYDSSSDDDQGGISSDDEDPFAFNCQKFNKNKPRRITSLSSKSSDGNSLGSLSDSSPEPKLKGGKGAKGVTRIKRRLRTKQVVSLDEKLQFLGKRRSFGDGDTCASYDSLSDDISSNENTGKAVSKKPAISVVDTILLGLSSSDEDMPRRRSLGSVASSTRRTTRTALRAAAASASSTNMVEANKDTVDALVHAKEAMEALREAQKYHAEDLEDDDDDNDDPMILEVKPRGDSFVSALSATSLYTSRNPTNESKEQIQPLEVQLGLPMCLSLRTMFSSNGTIKQGGDNKVFKIHKKERLQNLMNKFRKSNSATIPESSLIRFMFDGQSLALDKSPEFFDMEDDDLIDVVVTMPTSVSKNCSWVTIKTRMKHGDPRMIHEYKMRKYDPFQKIMDAYCNKRRQSGFSSQASMITLCYNGRNVKLSSNPQAEGIIDDAMIEICDEIELQQQVGNKLSLTQPSQILVKCRINGDQNKIQTYKVQEKTPLRQMMNDFFRRNGVDIDQCIFIFDGDRLNPDHTPQQLDIEGDEIIDVKIAENILVRAQPQLNDSSLKTVSRAECTVDADHFASNTSSSFPASFINSDTIVATEKLVVSIQVNRNNVSFFSSLKSS